MEKLSTYELNTICGGNTETESEYIIINGKIYKITPHGLILIGEVA